MPKIVREATQADVPGMARVRTDTWKTAYRGLIADEYLDSLTFPDAEERFRNSMSVPGRDEHFYVAEDRGFIVGFIIFGPERAVAALDRGEIYAVYVHPGHQRLGIGRQLFQAALDRLSVMGCVSLVVWTLDGGPAEEFYHRLGGRRANVKNADVGGKNYAHVAYCWSDTATLPTL